MTDTPDSPQGNSVAGLAAQIGTLGRRLADVEERLNGLGRDGEGVAELRGQVGELAGLVRELAEREETETRGERAVWWPDMRPGEERAEALRLLGGWVDEVLRARHPEAYKELQACWFLHTDVLDELTALRAAWFAAYRDTQGSTTAAIEWHDRWLPACMARCKAAIKARACNKSGHQDPVRTETFLGSETFKQFAEGGSSASL